MNNTLRPILTAIAANDRAAYDAALAQLLEDTAFSVPAEDYVDGVEIDIVNVMFQQSGYPDGIPGFPETEGDTDD